jgi:rod shape-determining protein MreB
MASMPQGLGIDLGTANTVVCHTKRGIVWDQPSMMVQRPGRRPSQPVAVGIEAWNLAGRLPGGLTLVRPCQGGIVGDLELTRTYLGAILRQPGIRHWRRPRTRAAIGVPVGATPLERRALREAAHEAGLGKTVLILEPVAGALGAGLAPLAPRTRLVADIGAGRAEVCAFSFGGVMAHRSTRLAGDEMTLALYQYLREQHQVVVDKVAAEELKIRASTEDSPSLVVSGMDAATGRGRLLTVAVEEVTEAVRPILDAMVLTLTACLDDLSPRAVSDVMEDGILAIGGGCLLVGFEKLMEANFGFSVCRAERPLTCMAEGAARCLAQPDVVAAYGGVT